MAFSPLCRIALMMAATQSKICADSFAPKTLSLSSAWVDADEHLFRCIYIEGYMRADLRWIRHQARQTNQHMDWHKYCSQTPWAIVLLQLFFQKKESVMENLKSVKAIIGYAIHASDGHIGKIKELYFDDADWRVRYVVVDTNPWLPGRKVLLYPKDVKDILWEKHEVQVAATREDVRGRPSIATDKPVKLQHEAEKKTKHNWALAFAGEATAAVHEIFEIPAFEPFNKNGKPFDPHLRSTKIVAGCTLQTSDGAAGRIVDFIFDDESWAICYLVIEVAGDKCVLFPPRFVKNILIDESLVISEIPMRLVTDGPALNSSTSITAQYEEAIQRHYLDSGDRDAKLG